MTRDLTRQAVTVATYIVTVAVNTAAVVIPLGGMTTAQLSDRFPVPVVPANFVFSIWSVIYLMLLGFTLYQARPSLRTDASLRRLGYLPALTGVLNAAWVLLWQYQVFALTVPVMLLLLATLIVIWLRAREPRAEDSVARGWLVLLPFSVYLGWITVATIANVSQQLYGAGFRGEPLGGDLWAAMLLLIGVGIAAVMVLRGRDVAFGAVIVWAYAGVTVKQAELPLVVAVAGAGALAVAVMTVTTILRPPTGSGARLHLRRA
jgi:hypothetical protein